MMGLQRGWRGRWTPWTTLSQPSLGRPGRAGLGESWRPPLLHTASLWEGQALVPSKGQSRLQTLSFISQTQKPRTGSLAGPGGELSGLRHRRPLGEAGWTKGREVVGEQNCCHHTDPAKAPFRWGGLRCLRVAAGTGLCLSPAQLCLRACVSAYTRVYPVTVSDRVLPCCLCVCA